MIWNETSNPLLRVAQSASHAAERARTEADIRSATDRQLAEIENLASISLDVRHEFTVASGRIDSVYERVIIEYKNPHSPSDKIGPHLSSASTQKLLKQIKSRFGSLQTELGQPINSLLGVGLDGNRFLFVRWQNEHWIEEEPTEVTHVASAQFLWALFNLGTAGKPFVGEFLANDFGARSGPARQLIGALYDAIRFNRTPKADVLFSEWKFLFGMVCGYDSINSAAKLSEVATLYDISAPVADPPALLFAVHTYYAIFMKLLVAVIMAFFHRLPSPLQRLNAAGSSVRFRSEAQEIERGGIFRHLNITNFLEGDLFSWYPDTLTDDVKSGLRELVRELDGYNPGTLSEEPSRSQDLLKDLYLGIIPRRLRHDLGEYYTPDWVAELVFDKIGFSGNPD